MNRQLERLAAKMGGRMMHDTEQHEFVCFRPDELEAFCKALMAEESPHWAATPLALFAGPTYYPSPGLHDLRGLFASLNEAEQSGKRIASDEYGWWQVVDLFTLNIVAGEGEGHSGLWGPVSAA